MVLLTGPVGSPAIVDHRVVSLSDPRIPESKQPYHAKQGTLEQNGARIAKRVKVVQRVTNRSVSQLLKDYRRNGYILRRAALVVGSVIDPNLIGNPHIRAHALEGRLFRTTLEAALRSHRLPSVIIVERNAYKDGSVVLARAEGKLKQTVSDLGRSFRHWRVDEKLAALAAWIALAQGKRRMSTAG